MRFSERLKRFSKRYWFVYLAIIVFSIALWSWLIPAKNRYSSKEKIGIFAAIKSGDENLFSQVIKGDNSNVKEVDVFSSVPSDSLFGISLSSKGKTSSDFFILPSSGYDENLIMSLCAPLDNDKLLSAFGNGYDLFELNRRTYGLKLFKDGETYLNSFLTYDDEESKEYILVFNRLSKNNSSIYNANGEETNNGVLAAKALLNYEEEKN